ncbi:MAG: PorT family protein [Lewinellaceae bacterium]|nr:PorT family protein [Lewinellaceae bacterium]
MKHLPIVIALALLPMAAQAQFSIGLKGGVNTQLSRPDDIVIQHADSSFNFGVQDVKFSTHFGLYARIGTAVFFQPEILFTSNKTDYRATTQDLGNIIKNERYNNLDIPLLVGFSAGPVRVHGGPVGHYFLNSKSELVDLNGYQERWKQMTWGWQAGLTFGRGRISGDLRYEGNFNKYGDQISFFGDDYHFATNPSRLILSLNIALVK